MKLEKGRRLWTEVKNCPVCKSDNAQITQLGALNDAVSVNCGTYARYRVSFMTQLRISDDVLERSTESSVLSYYIRRMQRDESTEPVLTDAMVEEFLKRQLPSAAEQADNSFSGLAIVHHPARPNRYS